MFGQMQGEAQKRIPSEFRDSYAKQPLIANKQFYFIAKEQIQLITSDEFLLALMKYWHTDQPLNEYLMKAIKL